MFSDLKETTIDRDFVEKEIESNINEVKDFLNSDLSYPFNELENKYIDPVMIMNKYITDALNFNPENKKILNIARIQWLKNKKAQVVIDAQESIKNLGKLAADVGLKGVLRGAREFCSDNIERFGMEEMFDENAVVCDIEDI
jgi:hypothetical protein